MTDGPVSVRDAAIETLKGLMSGREGVVESQKPLPAMINDLNSFVEKSCPATEYASRGENAPCDALNELRWILVQIADRSPERLIDENWGHRAYGPPRTRSPKP